MEEPTMTTYVRIMCTLYKQYQQKVEAEGGQRYQYKDVTLILLFRVCQFRRIYQFKTQVRWLACHPEIQVAVGLKRVPHRSTLSRRYPQLYKVIQGFIEYIATYVGELDDCFQSKHLIEDKSLFKAAGPVWHQADRQKGQVPAKLRYLDQDASWAKSGYQGWVYGYGLHLTCNASAFPIMVQVHTGTMDEGKVLDDKASTLIPHFAPVTLAADNRYTQASRIRTWAKQGTALLTPALKWRNGKFAIAYHHFLRHPSIRLRIRHRRTTIEPLFDLVAKVLGTSSRHKQLPIQHLPKVQTCLALAVLSIQIAMTVNNIFGFPFRSIAHFHALCA